MAAQRKAKEPRVAEFSFHMTIHRISMEPHTALTKIRMEAQRTAKEPEIFWLEFTWRL